MTRLAKAFAAFGSASALSTATQVVRGKLSAVILGAVGVGTVNQLTNFWSLLFTISGLGFYSGVVQRTAATRMANDRTSFVNQFTTSLIFLTLFASALALACIYVSPWMSDVLFSDGGRHASLVRIMSVSVPIAIIAQTYVGVLSGCQSVRPLVTAQVLSDVVALAAFGLLIWKFNLYGAVLAFVALHAFKAIFVGVIAHRALGHEGFRFDLRGFRWSEVRANLGFGISGFLLVSLASLNVMLVSRWIIERLGSEANGMFSVAWRICSVYFGAIYAATGSYYFPTLSATKDESELRERINEAVRLYMHALPPLVVVLLGGGQLILRAMFSREFEPAALLLVSLLPADLLRVLAEAIGLGFLARRRVVAYSALYIFWSATFLALVLVLLPKLGVIGVGWAYLISQCFNLVLVVTLARRSLSFSFDPSALSSIARGVGSCAAMAVAAFSVDNAWFRLSTAGFILAIWFGASLRDAEFRSLFTSFLRRVSTWTGVNLSSR